jgi:hypothetical protein
MGCVVGAGADNRWVQNNGGMNSNRGKPKDLGEKLGQYHFDQEVT